MPAVQLSILRNQIEKLIWLFNDPEKLTKELHNLLESYSNRGIYRPGRTIHPIRQINTYYTSPIIIREIEKGFKEKALSDPEAALVLADELWKEDFSEFRSFSAFLLGLVPVQGSDNVIQRVECWAQPTIPAYAMDALLDFGTQRLRREKPVEFLALIHKWLNSSMPFMKKIGLHALYFISIDEQFTDLPKVFTQIIPLVKQVPSGLQGELRHLLVVLIKRTPSETAYILRQIVFLNPNQETKRLLRKVLDELPDDLRVKLRDLVNKPDLTT